MKFRTLSFVVVLVGALAVSALEVPFLSGRINDLAGMMQPDTKQRVENTLEVLETETGSQIAVLTVPSLEGDVLEDYALRVSETWQLGRRDHDDGILILIAKQERRIRIEVGYGLEGAIPDIKAKRIIDGIMQPRFREGDFDNGIEDAVSTLSALVRGEAVELPDAGEELSRGEEIVARSIVGLISFLIIGLFSAVALFTKGGQAWFLYFFLVPFYASFPVAVLGPIGGLFVVAWLIGFPILRRFTWHSPWGRNLRKTHPGWVTFASSGGGGFSSGGFSGGGGSFGGGGASGGW